MRDLLYKWFVRNAGLKLVSLAIAVVLWWGVAGQTIAEIEYEVPVEFHNVPQNLEIATENVPKVRVRLRGPERFVRQVLSTEVHPEVDLSNLAGLDEGERIYDLNAGRINVPGTVEITQVVPSFVRVAFDQRATRTVPIRPRVSGSFVAGVRLKDVKVVPDKVTIVGPKRRVEAVESAFTDTIDATGLLNTSSFQTTAYVPDAIVRVIGPTQVKVTVEVVRERK